MRIAALTPHPQPGVINHVYRNLLPMNELGARGHQVYICQGPESEPQRLLDFDVVCFWRFFEAAEMHAARMLRRAGVAVVYDDDDDLVSMFKNSSQYKANGASGSFRYRRDLIEFMRCATIVTSPSETLSARFEEASRTTSRVLENYLPNDFGRAERGRGRGSEVVVGWIAASEHRVDDERLGIARTMRLLLEELPQLRLVTVGTRLDIDHERYGFHPGVEYGDLPAVLSGFDVGIAPLADVGFNRTRSNVKLKEYAANGVVWLASPMGSYVGVGEQQGGRLVPDDGWAAAVRELVLDRRARRKLAKQGIKWASGETIGRNVHRWEAVLEEAVERAALARA